LESRLPRFFHTCITTAAFNFVSVLLRQSFPKGSCLSGYLQRDLNKIAAKLNNQPRKILGFKTPAYKLDKALR